ncbi:alpha/beta fold hydrolase [Aestuariivivens sediminicola]|uniref:alpha/beta fold hydrolase n=1 Tax=Aestuariivivens sediminicola TaxID=2913560 RepID=UPI001F55EA03|nr:alpha/beta hydrolase [Aestuariivivens sediminicola]
MILIYKNTPIFFSDVGQGKPIVLLHGFLENSSIWAPFVKHLSKHNRIICIDLLGHGQTHCMGYVHTMEMMADAIHHVLSHLKISTCDLIGHSMGGYVALALIDNYPHIVKGVLLVNSTSQNDSDERRDNRDRAIAAVKHDHKTFIRIAVSNLFNPEHKSKFQQQIEKVTEEALKISVQSIIAALEGMKIRKNRTQVIGKFEHKKVIFISKKDPVLDYNSLLKEAQNAGLKIVEFPDGHMSFIENEVLFSQNLMHFIEY